MSLTKFCLIIFIVIGLTSCSTYTGRSYTVTTGYGYTYYPRTYYAYQVYPYYNAYYPYGYPYYVNRPVFWLNQSWSVRGYNYVPGNYWRAGYGYRGYRAFYH